MEYRWLSCPSTCQFVLGIFNSGADVRAHISTRCSRADLFRVTINGLLIIHISVHSFHSSYSLLLTSAASVSREIRAQPEEMVLRYDYLCS